jgi:hypothetical protein
MVGNVLLTSVYTCLMGRFGTEPFAPSLLRHLLTSSMTLESTPRWVVSRRWVVFQDGASSGRTSQTEILWFDCSWDKPGVGPPC